MVLQYLHGIETIDVDDDIRPIQTVRSAIIGLIGTAPDADVDLWPLNTPCLIAGNPRVGVTLGTTGTLPDALAGLFKQTAPVIVVIRVEEGVDVNHTFSNFVGSPLTQTGVYAFNKAKNLLSLTPKIIIAPGYTSQMPIDGVSHVNMNTGGGNYTKNVTCNATGNVGAGGMEPTFTVTVVGGIITAVTPRTKGFGLTGAPTLAFVDNGAVKATGHWTIANTTNATDGDTVTIGAKTYTLQTSLTNTANFVKIGATAADTIANLVQAIIAGTGAGTLYGAGTTANASASAAVDASNLNRLAVTALTAGYAGNSIATTTVSTNGAFNTSTLTGGLGGTGATATAVVGVVANPVVAETLSILDGLRAIMIADTPGTSYTNAIAWRNQFDSMRLWPVEGGILEWDDETSEPIAVPVAPYLAGMQAWVDDHHGFWFSASNWPLNGVIGVNRAIDFSLFSSNSEGQLLNEVGVAIVDGSDTGYRIMGVRSPTSNSLWEFISVRRTADMVYESIEQGVRYAVDKPISIGVIDWVEGSVRSYLRTLAARGAIIDGNIWIDRTQNPVTELQNGHITFDFDLEPPAPMERITFRAHRNAGYYSEILDQVIKNNTFITPVAIGPQSAG